jgi:Patatin phospholipase
VANRNHNRQGIGAWIGIELYEFSRQTMEEHWRSGHEDASRAISHPEIFERPDTIDGFRALDFSGRHFSAGKN